MSDLTQTLAETATKAAGPGMLVGCDVVDVPRLRATLERRPALRARVFTPRELADARRGGVAAGSEVEAARLAARFAAKEAVRKARADLRLAFHAVEVRTGAHGAPALYEHGCPSRLRLSLSHDGDVALAVVVGERARDPLGLDDPPAPPNWEGLPGLPALTDLLDRPRRIA